ncbi:MAG: Bug family tripartite tricarboxylate transporter substrate binding protein [Burkholderiales bacterium]
MTAHLSRIAAGVVLAIACGQTAAQEKWPVKPIRMVVPFPNTAASDALSRIVGERLGQMYGQQFVIDNRPGAGGLIGSELIRNAAPDGYTFGMVGQPHLSNVLLRDTKPYDPLKDFTAITLVGITPNVLVIGKGVEAKTIPELIALAKAKPGALNYGSAGVGSSSHLAGALFTSKAKINVVHVPFRAGGDSRSALLAGAIHFYVFPLPAIVGGLRAGQFRGLAIASQKRAEALPDLQTSAEAGFPEYISESWFGIVAPRALPRQFITRLNADTVKVLQEPGTREKIVRSGAEPRPSTPEGFAKLQRDEYVELGKLIKEIGMKIQ